MQLEAALDQLLAPYLSRLQVQPGNGLTRSMNGSLRSYPAIPLIVRRSVDCLATLEYLFGTTGAVSITCPDLYQILINAHEDWHLEVPVIAAPGNAVSFIRKPRLPRHQFTAAWAIARRINLLTGWGVLRLHSEALKEFCRLLRAPLGPGWYDKV